MGAVLGEDRRNDTLLGESLPPPPPPPPPSVGGNWVKSRGGADEAGLRCLAGMAPYGAALAMSHGAVNSRRNLGPDGMKRRG